MNTLIKTFSDVKIYVTPEGKFTANLAGSEINRASIREIERAIMQQNAPARGFLARSWSTDDGYIPVGVVSIDSDGVYLLADRKRERWGPIYFWDDETVAALAANRKAQRECEEKFDNEFNQILKRAKPITRASLKEWRAKEKQAKKEHGAASQEVKR